jgi:hypothetical protein
MGEWLKLEKNAFQAIMGILLFFLEAITKQI